MSDQDTNQEQEGAWAHPLLPTVSLINTIIERQLELFMTLSVRESVPESATETRVWDETHADRMIAAEAALKVIRRQQDRLLKMTIDLEVDGDLMVFKEIKKRAKQSQPEVNDDPETQA